MQAKEMLINRSSKHPVQNSADVHYALRLYQPDSLNYQSIDQSINQSTNQSIDQSFK